MGPPSYMWSIVDRNVVMRPIPVLGGTRRREAHDWPYEPWLGISNHRFWTSNIQKCSYFLTVPGRFEDPAAVTMKNIVFCDTTAFRGSLLLQLQSKRRKQVFRNYQ